MRPFFGGSFDREYGLVRKKRLCKSSNAVIGGVCGGIAEYFDIDATLVRILAVALLVVGWGVPAILYVIFLIVLPPDSAKAQGYVDARAEATRPQYDYTVASAGSDQPPPPDPTTRVKAPRTHMPGEEGKATAFATFEDSLPGSYQDDAYANAYAYSYVDSQDVTQSFPYSTKPSSQQSVSQDTRTAQSVAESVKSNSPLILVIGAVLIGVGVIALLSNFVHISLWRFWPVVLIVVGVVCLFTPGNKGWSLERAGNSIVLITVGLALLAWMLQVIQTRVFVMAFLEFWPVLLVIAGIFIIGAARKSSVVKLASALVFSAMIVFGLWIYVGLDWATLGATPVLAESDGLQEFLADIRNLN
jgi:phage shock protein C